MTSYYLYINGTYLYPVSHSHACSLIGVELPLTDVAGTGYERDMGDGRVIYLEKSALPAAATSDYGYEDRDCGYTCDGTPIGG